MPDFIGGLELSRRFYHEAIRPILDAEFPDLRHSAALIGSGSEVLGYDTERSTDHGWGPRILLFLTADDVEHYRAPIFDTLARQLSRRFLGYSTYFDESPAEPGTAVLADVEPGPINHGVTVTTVEAFWRDHVGLDADAAPTVADSLTLPEQKLLELTAGAVFHDGLGTLAPLRARYAYYPQDVWRYRLAAQWQRLGQLEPFVGRTGEVGDDLGSGLIAASQVRDVMRLCFLMERRYAPYPKWFGAAFARLLCAPTLTPLLTNALRATSWQERERHLSPAYEHVAEMHNALAITPPLDPTVRPFSAGRSRSSSPNASPRRSWPPSPTPPFEPSPAATARSTNSPTAPTSSPTPRSTRSCARSTSRNIAPRRDRAGVG
ncbi:MAG: DUF4037 domain-containing protein [Thermomicrobiales bacterium]